MQITSRFSIAIHMLTAIDTFQKDIKVTSNFLASSVNVNPVIIRKTMQQLKSAGIINSLRGSSGITIAKPLNEITLLEIFQAVEPIEDNQLFHFHENPSSACPVGRNIHAGLDDKLLSVQNAMEDKLRSYTLEDVVKDTQARIQLGK